MSTPKIFGTTSRVRLLGIGAVVVSLISGCASLSGPAGPVDPGSRCPIRGDLCFSEMFNIERDTLTDYRYFSPVRGAAEAIHQFSGSLVFGSEGPAGVGGREPANGSLDFVSVGDVLVPVESGIISSGASSELDLILSPGLIWSEPGDHGMSRASFPFTLVGRFSNAAFNGVATFLYSESEVSPLHFQIAQETAPRIPLDYSDVQEVGYRPGGVSNESSIKSAYMQEVSGRIEAAPLTDLSDQFDTGYRAAFSRGLDPSEISASGIVLDGKLFYQEARTRHGLYPYPLEMRHGIFSITKSMGAALALLRLAEKYDDNVFDLKVSDYVDVTAEHDGWEEVTFSDLLSMVSGIGDNDPDDIQGNTFADENDENSPLWIAFFEKETAEGKLDAIFRYGKYPWGAGQVVRYNTSLYFVLGVAMDAYLKSMEGPEADIWRLLTDEVFIPLDLGEIPTLRTVENDGELGIPLFGHGMFLNAYETARILQLFQDEGAIGVQQLLHKGRVREMLRRGSAMDYSTSSSTLAYGGQLVPVRYLHSFWSFPLGLGGDCTVRVPYMEGYGGSFAVVMPNGVSAYRYADAFVMDPGGLAITALALRPAC